MNFQNDCEFYCVSYNNPEKSKIMKERFMHFGIDLHIHGVQHDDYRLIGGDVAHQRLSSCFYGHIDNIKSFYQTGKKYGFICEDDIHIHRDFGILLPKIIEHFETMQLDILLLGYMTIYPIKNRHTGFDYMMNYDPMRKYQYHAYPEDLWGIHLAMLSRDYAKKIIDTFDNQYAFRTLFDSSLTPANPDWTITKLTKKRALIYPMLAVEDGKGVYEHLGQRYFHQNSHKFNYIPDMFV